MRELVKEALELIGFSEKYLKLCNQYKEYDHAMNFDKVQVEKIINQNDTGFKYVIKEKLFYKDYSFIDLDLRFVITFKYGFIDCIYDFLSNKTENSLGGGFGTIATIQDPDFESKVAYKFPIATSIADLESILKSIMQLHSDFILHL